ncbi:cysteine desulfurase [Fulvivirgaceae bacterium PWU5]|uniref:cysteine desulfurase n=1 Tax=Dawidia cretensis TaxID=2782350 RepID=A0AAP2E3C4_9BACT|nr:cysteine desulfurase family protein [Dawidia cretensis]MBT1712310.1 cysteine desulfurase [Dawidia cretensis]
MSDLIYFDNNSTTPVDPRVVEAMMPYFSTNYGNPSSGHQFGASTAKHLDLAREKVAGLLCANPNDLVITSGATESINIGIIGYALKHAAKGKHIITINTEHKAVLETVSYLESIGFENTIVGVDTFGRLNLDQLSGEIRTDTILVASMFANNETGNIHPIKEIANIVHGRDVALFCDATQAIGKIPTDVRELDIDLLAFSAHKFYGPKGVGCLYVKGLKQKPANIQPIYFGGGHEQGIRSGTFNVPAIVGMGVACEIAYDEMKTDSERIIVYRNLLERELLSIPESTVNGDRENRMFNVTNICFPGLDANTLVARLSGVAMSNGSACTSSIVQPSHVLKAMGLTDEQSNASLRFSLGRFTTENEIEEGAQILKEAIENELIRC